MEGRRRRRRRRWHRRGRRRGRYRRATDLQDLYDGQGAVVQPCFCEVADETSVEARAADGKRLVVGCGRAACRYAHREHAIDVQLVHAILDKASTQMRPRVERHRGAVTGEPWRIVSCAQARICASGETRCRDPKTIAAVSAPLPNMRAQSVERESEENGRAQIMGGRSPVSWYCAPE